MANTPRSVSMILGAPREGGEEGDVHPRPIVGPLTVRELADVDLAPYAGTTVGVGIQISAKDHHAFHGIREFEQRAKEHNVTVHATLEQLDPD